MTASDKHPEAAVFQATIPAGEPLVLKYSLVTYTGELSGSNLEKYLAQ